MALCRMCSTVICCRVSPIQKADIVTMVPRLSPIPIPSRSDRQHSTSANHRCAARACACGLEFSVLGQRAAIATRWSTPLLVLGAAGRAGGGDACDRRWRQRRVDDPPRGPLLYCRCHTAVYCPPLPVGHCDRCTLSRSGRLDPPGAVSASIGRSTSHSGALLTGELLATQPQRVQGRQTAKPLSRGLCRAAAKRGGLVVVSLLSHCMSCVDAAGDSGFLIRF